MSGIASSLDHVGIAGADLPALAETFEKLGFTLTRAARHTGSATGNQCIMFAAGYLELIAVVDPAGTSPTLAAMLARYAGAHIVALAVDDAAAALPRLARTGLGITEVVQVARDDVRFATLPLTDAPEGRLLLIQHLTPEALRPARYLGHTNRVVALREVVIATAMPAEAAARFSRLTGLPVQPDPLGGFVLTVGAGPRSGKVRLLPPAAVADVFRGASPPVLPWIAGVVLETDDGNAALSRRLTYYKIPFQTLGSQIVLTADGTHLSFRAAAPSIEG
jgi:hypothetical protein